MVLRDENGPQGTGRMVVDLATGAYRSRLRLTTPQAAPIDAEEVGRCRMMPFTHIP